jgi:hypothetical protein
MVKMTWSKFVGPTHGRDELPLIRRLAGRVNGVMAFVSQCFPARLNNHVVPWLSQPGEQKRYVHAKD